MIRKWRFKSHLDSDSRPLTMTSNPGFQDDDEEVRERISHKKQDSSVEKSRDSKISINGHVTQPPEKEDFGFLENNIRQIKSKLSTFLKTYNRIIHYVWLFILNSAVIAYFFVALSYWYKYNILREWDLCSGFGMLLILYSLVYFLLIYYVIVKPFFGKAILRALKPVTNLISRGWKFWYVKLGVMTVFLAAFLTFILFDTIDSRERLISLGGYLLLLLLGFIFSKYPGRIIWRPVLWGMFLHFVMGLITIRWEVGRAIFQCMGEKVNIFLSYAAEGSEFVFGKFLVREEGVFAFQVLPVIFFFSLIIEVLFFWGGMQWICLKLGWMLQVTMGTTVCESVICSANIFLGMSESPLLIKPYIADLTKSEIHTIMCSGFATVSGTVLAAYISFGVNPAHLITASVMATPAALCVSKLLLPETKISKTAVTTIQSVETPHSSVLDAATAGASNAISLVLNIAANLVAFVSVVAFLNGILSWLGMLVGLDFLSFEWLIGKIFMPLSFILGVPWNECEVVGELIGLKTVVNEFVAYERMGQYIKQGLISPRAETIATYALCGFTNPSSLGILVGALSAMAPTKRADITSVAFRGLLAGCFVCFMSACVAGLLVSPDMYRNPDNSTRLYGL